MWQDQVEEIFRDIWKYLETIDVEKDQVDKNHGQGNYQVGSNLKYKVKAKKWFRSELATLLQNDIHGGLEGHRGDRWHPPHPSSATGQVYQYTYKYAN